MVTTEEEMAVGQVPGSEDVAEVMEAPGGKATAAATTAAAAAVGVRAAAAAAAARAGKLQATGRAAAQLRQSSRVMGMGPCYPNRGQAEG